MLVSLVEFRGLVDRVKPQLPSDARPEDAKTFVGIQDDVNYQRSKVSDLLRQRILSSFSSGQKNVFDHCRKLITELIHEHEANGAERDPYYEILSVIKDTVRGNAYAPRVVGDWTAAVQAAVNYSHWSGAFHTDLYEGMHAAEILQARTLKKLKGLGKGKRVQAVPQVLPEEQRRILARTIDTKFAKNMGAQHIAKHIFHSLSHKFDSQMERYHEVDQFRFGTEMQSRLPLGLLMNYAAKYPTPSLPKRHGESDWKHLLEASKNFAAAYGVQPQTYLDGIHVDQKELLPFMRRLAVHDTLFSLQQTRPSDVTRIIGGLVDGLRMANRFPVHLDGEVDNLIQVIQAIQRVVGKTQGPLQIDLSDVVENCPSLSQTEVATALRDVFAHAPGMANKNFTIPDEIPDDALPRSERAGPNYGDRPLLTLQRDRYLLLDHSVNAPAMIEAVLTRLREKGLDADIGYGIEGLLHTELQLRSIATKTGKYVANGKTWECDVVIETDERIIFIETKKKSLTRAARSGFDVALLVDMADSLVSATLQGLRHELQIRTTGFIDLTQTDGSVIRVDLQGRTVDCIAVTLPDYGSFQDRIVISRVLNGGMRLSFSTEDTAFETKLKKVNKKLDELRDTCERLYVQVGKPANWRPFWNCWFLSIPQILVLLDGVTGPAQLEGALKLTRYTSSGTKDFYFDLYGAKQRANLI